MPGGRPTKYSEAHPEQARRLALLGLTDEELAQFFGVHIDTIYEWDKVHPEFSDARARGKLPADGKVAERLYHRAIGYRHQVEKVFMPAGATAPVVADYIESLPPDTQAATWWLKNRQPAKWKEKSEVDMSGDLNLHRVIADRPQTEDEWSTSHAPDKPDAA